MNQITHTAPAFTSWIISEDFKMMDEWSIDYKDLNDIPYDLDIDQKTIFIHNFGLSEQALNQSSYFKPQSDLAMIESMRMVRHVEWLEGAMARYHPETILLVGRICVADCQIQKIVKSYNEKMNGNDLLWKHILCSDLTDMAQAFEKALEKFMDTGHDLNLSMRQSMAVAFNRWFSCHDRLQQCDHDTLNLMDDMIEEGSQFGTKRLEHNAVVCLTLMTGDNTSYIDSHLQKDILNNPYYRDVTNDINEIHLMHVINDMNKTHVNGVSFSDPQLAARFAVCE